MASRSANTQSASSAQHYETLLSKRQLQRGLTFKPVAIHVMQFGDDALNTENFIDRVHQLSTTDRVKNSGGFIVIRPENGIEQFTMNTDDNKTSNEAENVWNALPSLNKDKHRTEILYERQNSGNWSFPLFTWDTEHKAALKKQYESKSNHSKMLLQLQRQSTTGQKRKNEDTLDSPQPRKRQKTNTNTNTSIDNTNGSNIDLQFYRGFCCMTKKYERYCKDNLEQYIDTLQRYTTKESSYDEDQKIENKWLTFIKYFYDENTVNYGHIEQDITCYNEGSPFKSADLKNYGPFACLEEEEYTKGIQIPYIYVGDSHSFFAWHNEDMNFHSVNHLLYGGDKIWFCIAAADYRKVMEFFSKQFKYYYTDCLTPLQHKNCLMDPYIFLCLGINVYYIIQKPGDMVIAPPGALHCGFNQSFNIAEAVNFMTMDDNQWILSLSAMLLKTHNYHDCCATEDLTQTPCICCNKQCTNPEKRFECKCKYCDPLKCPCDYTMFLDINELGERVRHRFGRDIGPKHSVVPLYDITKAWNDTKHGYCFKMYHPRKMSNAEVDDRWISPPKCKREYIYPTQDRKDRKFYPAICYSNRIIKKNELLLCYQYQMDFIAFGEYYQICDESQIVDPGGVSAYVWNNPPIGKQHGFYKNTKLRRNSGSANVNHKHKSLLQKQLKGTPSFDFLKIEYNTESPLFGTEWQHKKVIYAYPPGARKYNLEIRKKKVQNRLEQEKKMKISALSSSRHYVDMYQDDDPDIVVYQIEEYNDTESSSSSNSQDKWFESTAEDEEASDDDNDDAWTPDTNKWMGTLPEYQYTGLRARANANAKTKTNKRYSTRSALNNDIHILNKTKTKTPKQTKKRGRARGRPKKYAETDDDDDDDDSEDEYILRRNGDDGDYKMKSKSKKKKKSKRKHSKRSKDKKKKEKERKSSKKRKHKDHNKKKKEKDKKKNKSRTKSKTVPKKEKTIPKKEKTIRRDTDKREVQMMSINSIPNINMLPVIPDIDALNRRHNIMPSAAVPSLMMTYNQQSNNNNNNNNSASNIGQPFGDHQLLNHAPSWIKPHPPSVSQHQQRSNNIFFINNLKK